MDRKLRKSLLMKILYSMGKGQGALSRKGHEGPRGFLSPWRQWSQVLQKTAWKDSSGKNCLPACLQAPPLGEMWQHRRAGNRLCPCKCPFSPFQLEVTPSSP